MRKLGSLSNYYMAVKIQAFYVMLPILVISFLWVTIIRIRGQYTDFPYFNKFLLSLIFVAGLKSGYEFRKKTFLFYSLGLFFILLYFFAVVIYCNFEWNAYSESGCSVGQLALENIKSFALILVAGFGGCAVGKWIRGFTAEKPQKEK